MRLSLCHRSTIPIVMGKATITVQGRKTSRPVYLQYHPQYPVLQVETPNHYNQPHIPIHWHFLRNSRQTRQWITSPLHFPEVLQWFQQQKQEIAPEIEAAWEDYQAREEQIQLCQQGQMTDLNLPSNSLGLTPLEWQVSGAWFLLCRGRALLADDVGLGKTLQFSLAWKMGYQTQYLKRILIATQKSTLYQISQEFAKITQVDPLMIAETYTDQELGDHLFDPRHLAITISHHRLRNFIQNTQQGAALGDAFDVLVIDEAQAIKNRTRQVARYLRTIATPFLWLVTATPIENNLEEAHSLLQFIDPLAFGSWSYFFDKYCIPDFFGGIKSYKRIEDFKHLLNQVTLRRSHKIAATIMPTVVQFKIALQLSPSQRHLYDEFAEQTQTAIALYEKKRGRDKSTLGLQVLELYTALRQICDHPLLMDEEWEATETGTKLQWFRNMLQHPKDINWVVYTQWRRMQDLLIPLFSSLHLFLIHGGLSAKKRQENIAAFHESPWPRVLLCTDAAKCGLNLQTADTLINVERSFNPATADQRGGRINRLGSSGTKIIMTLYCKDTVEERIEDLVHDKRNLISDIMGTRPPMEQLIEVLRT